MNRYNINYHSLTSLLWQYNVARNLQSAFYNKDSNIKNQLYEIEKNAFDFEADCNNLISSDIFYIFDRLIFIYLSSMSFISSTYWQERVQRGVAEGGRGGGCNILLPPLFKNLSVFWQNVSVKLPDPVLSVNLEYFIIKNEIQNSINNQSGNQTLTDDAGF